MRLQDYLSRCFLPAIAATALCISEIYARPMPNIVLMMADDMGIGDTSAYLGKPVAEETPPLARTLLTPNLEAFAKQGVVFTKAYAPASMCSSTRYSLLTGRFAHRSYLKQQGWLPHGPNTPMIQRELTTCLLYTSPSPRDGLLSRMPSSA